MARWVRVVCFWAAPLPALSPRIDVRAERVLLNRLRDVSDQGVGDPALKRMVGASRSVVLKIHARFEIG